MKVTIEPITISTSICTFRCGDYIVQLQTCDLDPAVHGGLNIVLHDDTYAPITSMFEGSQIFVLKNTSGQLRDGEVGWLIIAGLLESAIAYATHTNHPPQ